jgi:hypothetical protein
MTPLAKRILLFEGVYAAVVAALLLAAWIGIPSQGEENLAAWAILFLAAPLVLLVAAFGVQMETMWASGFGPIGLLAFYGVIVAVLAMLFRGGSAADTNSVT